MQFNALNRVKALGHSKAAPLFEAFAKNNKNHLHR